jgi:uncharacterized protein (DUF1499 family)
MGNAASAPVINDVSTNVDNPPKFTKSAHPDHLSDALKEAIRKHYSDLQSLVIPLSKADSSQAIIDATKQAATGTRPQIQVVSSSDTTAELLDVTALCRFKDDVSIRVEKVASSGDYILDIRSASRVGKGDLGTNANRIRSIISALKSQLQL